LRLGTNFTGFYDKELQFRAWMHYPPYNAIANVLIRSEKTGRALTWSGELEDGSRRLGMRAFECLGPQPRPSSG